MTKDPDQVDTATADADEADARRGPGADRMPTAEEERRAEQAAAGLEGEMDDAAAHYEEMTRIGAEVEGEGKIPD